MCSSLYDRISKVWPPTLPLITLDKRIVKNSRRQRLDRYISIDLPDPANDLNGYKFISEFMIHGPCGLVNISAPCMKDGSKCNRHFPKPYYDKTYIDKDGYVHYRRRETGIDTERQNVRLDNSNVVPYNRSLCMRAECEALGLLGGDQEWVGALQEAAVSATSVELRILFMQILIFCDVSDPVSLWETFWKDMSDDIPRRLSKTLQIPRIEKDKIEMKASVLLEIETILNSHSKSLKA
ncbi:hypothetical protein Tco_0262231 [Tanacetum coccineum]